MKYTLRQLEVFLAIAHYQNMTRAAESLNMSQSAASSALKDLEDQFSIRLFDRIGKRLKINELGQLVRPKAEALLSQAKELEDDFRQHIQTGDLNVGATLTIGNYLAVELVAQYMREHEGCTVHLDVANTASIVSKVANFELDIGLIEGELNHPDLEVIPWCEDELQPFCSPHHPLASKSELTDEDLVAADWILRETGSGTRQAFDRAMSGLLPQLRPAMELQHTEAIKRAVKAQLGVGCLSRIVIQEAVEYGTLVPLQASHRSWRRQFYFILHRQKYRSAGIDQWVSLCREAVHTDVVKGNQNR